MLASEPLLKIDGLSASYGRGEALKSSSLFVKPGEIVIVLGPNGAGKSTLMRATMGLLKTRGTIHFKGCDISKWLPQRRANAGMTLVPEGRGIFSPLTVMENLELGSYGRYARSSKLEIRRSFDAVFGLFPRLAERRTQKAGLMSGGEQQMLALGRALMAAPSLLLLDEPSLGLAPRVTEEIMRTLSVLNKQGLTILLVEQKAPLALRIAERVYVLRNGGVVAEMVPNDIQSPQALAALYLGTAIRCP